MRFVLASKNRHKIFEMRRILSPLGAELFSQEELGVDFSPEETGDTFEENALIKARALFELTGVSAIADDSGLCVDALSGAPGVRSARYCEGSDRDRTARLLEVMQNVPDGERTAQFVSVIACVLRDKTSFCCRGECEGVILREEKGNGGFGYDPVFYVPEHKMTFSEMPPDLKNRISHRARALSGFLSKLKEHKLK